MAGQFTIAAEQIYYCGTKTAQKKTLQYTRKLGLLRRPNQKLGDENRLFIAQIQILSKCSKSIWWFFSSPLPFYRPDVLSQGKK